MEVRHEFAAFVAFGDEGGFLVQHIPRLPQRGQLRGGWFASRHGLPAGDFRLVQLSRVRS